ncbi:hypothetical protein ABK046_49695, partial [Streptomyces caeruleatus]
ALSTAQAFAGSASLRLIALEPVSGDRVAFEGYSYGAVVVVLELEFRVFVPAQTLLTDSLYGLFTVRFAARDVTVAVITTSATT